MYSVTLDGKPVPGQGMVMFGIAAGSDPAADNQTVHVPFAVDENGSLVPATTSKEPARVASSAATNNATLVSAEPATLLSFSGYNAAATPLYLKFYNKATAPNPAADTPWLVYALPAQDTFSYSVNVRFPVGMGFALVTGAADSDNTAVQAGDILGLNIIWS